MDEAGYRTARHESHHVAAAALVGWTVTGASRTSGWEAVTNLVPRLDGDIRTRGEELGVILICPMLADPIGSGPDLSKLSTLVQSGVSLSHVWSKAETMMQTPTYRQVRADVEGVLLVNPVIGRHEMVQLIAAASSGVVTPW